MWLISNTTIIKITIKCNWRWCYKIIEINQGFCANYKTICVAIG